MAPLEPLSYLFSLRMLLMEPAHLSFIIFPTASTLESFHLSKEPANLTFSRARFPVIRPFMFNASVSAVFGRKGRRHSSNHSPHKTAYYLI